MRFSKYLTHVCCLHNTSLRNQPLKQYCGFQRNQCEFKLGIEVYLNNEKIYNLGIRARKVIMAGAAFMVAQIPATRQSFERLLETSEQLVASSAMCDAQTTVSPLLTSFGGTHDIFGRPLTGDKIV